MPRPFVLSLVVVALGCGGSSTTAGLFLEVSSRVSGVDALRVTALGPAGAIVVDADVLDGGTPTLPGRVRVEAPMRSGDITVLAWGLRAGVPVAFGAATLRLGDGQQGTTPVVLDTPPADADGDRIPNAWDNCRYVPNPTQANGDRDGGGDACGCVEGLFGPGGFEDSAGAWTASSATFERRTPGADGSNGLLRVCRNGGGADYNVSGLVPGTFKAGGAVRFEALMRSTGAAQSLFPILWKDAAMTPGCSSSDAACNQEGTDQAVSVGSGWQLVRTRFIPNADTSSMTLELQSESTTAGACFEVDAICIRREP